MGEQPEDNQPIGSRRLTYETECTDIEQPQEVAAGEELTLKVWFNAPEFVHPGNTLTIREPDGTTHEVECLNVDIGTGPDGEYMETCRLGPCKVTPPESPA